jgi:addiction module HigA family antidote
MNTPNFVNQSKKTERPDSLYRPHPGQVFKRRFISKTTLKQEKVAKRIGISFQHLSRFLNCEVDVDVELSNKLSTYTNLSAYAWLHYQTQHDCS